MKIGYYWTVGVHMFQRLRLAHFGAFLLLFAALFTSLQASAAPPAEAFGSLPQGVLGRLSPDGKRLAVIRPYNGREKVAFYDLTKTDAAPYIVGMQDALAGEVYWKSNTVAICVFHVNLKRQWSKYINAWSRAVSVNVPTQTATLLMFNAPFFKGNYDVGSITDIAAGDPDHVYMTEVDRWDREYTLDFYSVAVATGVAALVQHGDARTIGFISDGYGHLLGQIDQDTDLTNHVFLGSADVFDYKVKGGPDFEIEGLVGSANSQFAVKKMTASGTTGLYLWGAAGFGAGLFENPNYDIDNVFADESNQRVTGVTYIDDMPRTKYFDPAMQRVQDSLEAAYPGQTVTIESKDEAGSEYVILTEGPKNSPILSLFIAANHQANIIDEAYDSIKPSDLGDVKPYPYKSRDGIDIHAYLTLPPGRDPHNLPTVIFPHGGPEARDYMSFDWWAQFMASRGYAVFQPNFRGSTGYGEQFVRAGDGEWAGKVQDDVQDGVKKLIADGISDPKRICIVGASYGGYMALAGATFSPDLYACAVSYAGMSDLDRMLETGTLIESEGITVWKRRIGADVDSRKPAAASPANFADRVRIPILLIHSDKDITVPIEQSQIEQRALKRAGKQVEFVTLEGDDHYLEYGDTRIKLLKEIERFLASNIGN